MKEFSIISVTIINIIIGVRYCYLTYHKKIQPSLAMWTFFTTAVAMSLATYMAEGDFSLWDNILNTTDLLLVGTISVFILIFGEKSARFDRFDTFCLAAVAVIAVFWFTTQTHILSHMLIESIMLIAYIPVIRRLWKSKENTEPYSVWILLMIAPVFSLLSSKGLLATIYAVRAILSTGILMLLMLRIDYLGRREMKKVVRMNTNYGKRKRA